MPIKKPICHIILLDYKEKRKTATGPRLQTSERLDYQKPLPPTPDPITE